MMTPALQSVIDRLIVPALLERLLREQRARTPGDQDGREPTVTGHVESQPSA